ncbi:MAG TPA: IS607 family element RNA-guided endonuclease TnpB, partial [Candidatus Dormibacteraeota bacterium]|nr:IS607 family element RNA-guided endonuclease TnpB [Candidatus Dormibacteraeota bacterium]
MARRGAPRGQPRGEPRRYAAPDGWTLQAFQFALDPTPKQWQTIRRQWGGRRYAYNWAVRTLKADLEAYHATGESREPPSFYGLRWRWNREKATECLDRETGEGWWPQISKEAFANGIKDAVDAYWRWQQSRAGKLDGRRVGFPRFKRKGRDPDRCTFSTGPLRIEPDRRHVTLPRIGTVRTCENTRRLERLIRLGRARILAATLKRVGERAIVVFRVEVQRPQGCPTRLASWGAPQRGHPDPDSTVGVDVGVRWLVTVATADGMIERVPNPAPLARNLTVLRRLSRSISRSQRGSNRCRRKERRRARLHARIAAIRRHEIHRLTTRLAKTHGRIVVEGLDAAGMLRQNGL